MPRVPSRFDAAPLLEGADMKNALTLTLPPLSTLMLVPERAAAPTGENQP